MAGLKHENLARAYRLMHARGVTTDALAAELMTARTYISRAISGYERSGRVWQRIKRLLTAEEVALLESFPLPEPKVQKAVSGTRPAQVCAVVPQPLSVQSSRAAPVNTAGPTIRRFSQWREQEKAS